MAQINGPKGTLAAELSNRDGKPTLEVRRDGRTVIEPSPLGIRTLEAEFVEELTAEKVEEESIDERYELPLGKTSEYHHRATEATFSLSTPTGASVELDVRVATDGIAYRYRLLGDGEVTVTGEESGFCVPPSEVWYHPYNDRHEAIGRASSALPLSGAVALPATFQLEADDWVLLTEAGVDGRYAASRLTTGFKDACYAYEFPGSVTSSLPLETPWRVAIVGDRANLVESTLVTDLVDGSARTDNGEREGALEIEDFDWVRPGRVAWSWWSDIDSPGDYECQRSYVDYAADRGWEYVLIDNGWKPEWVPDLVSYANERGVDVLLWERWQELDTDWKREDQLARWKSWGVAGVKIDFMNSDRQERLQFYDDMAAATADYELMVNFHGSIVPLGLRRRWPHIVTYEGVYGAEQHPRQTPTHSTVLPFTRNILGPMDYTPVAFAAPHRLSTAAHELALAVLFESGHVHVAEGIDELGNRPVAESFLETVPATWDETRFLRGRPGTEATLARRSGETWFVASASAGPDKTIDLPLEFLEDEYSYAVNLVRDADDDELELVERSAEVDETLSVPVPENGGFCARFTPK
ncbi:glycoside hydrolase family 97 protein [Halomontanus rarus]|uniref:glycoside hydrolase family 97 protein n=1 Tax=Halomontanus rarus TaxID=3034020 RepID=UPI0023E87648|nr:glycoside hydrolase family 97 protein [Halovivax sp. TS33]